MSKYWTFCCLGVTNGVSCALLVANWRTARHRQPMPCVAMARWRFQNRFSVYLPHNRQLPPGGGGGGGFRRRKMLDIIFEKLYLHISLASTLNLNSIHFNFNSIWILVYKFFRLKRKQFIFAPYSYSLLLLLYFVKDGTLELILALLKSVNRKTTL